MTHRTRVPGIAMALLVLALGLLAGARLLAGDDLGRSSLTAEATLPSAPSHAAQTVAPGTGQGAAGRIRAADRVDASRLHPRPAPAEVHGLNWAALAQCESGGDPRLVTPEGYFGLYQLTLAAWQSVGGQGSPAQADRHEQTLRAQQLYARRGTTPWPVCARYL